MAGNVFFARDGLLCRCATMTPMVYRLETRNMRAELLGRMLYTCGSNTSFHLMQSTDGRSIAESPQFSMRLNVCFTALSFSKAYPPVEGATLSCCALSPFARLQLKMHHAGEICRGRRGRLGDV